MEGSPSGLWRTLGKRVGCKPSRVRIPLPPPGRVARSKRPGDFLLINVLTPVMDRRHN